MVTANVSSEKSVPLPPNTTVSSLPADMKSVSPTYHCPNCGEKFTEKMFGMLKEHKETYCEFCGHRVDLIIPANFQ